MVMLNQLVNQEESCCLRYTAFPFSNAWHAQGADAASPLVERLPDVSVLTADDYESLRHGTPGPSRLALRHWNTRCAELSTVSC